MKFFAPALALLAAACAQRAPEPSSARRAIIGGTQDDGDPSVVAVLIEGGTTGGSICSGEIISPHVVLTAAHCVDATQLGNARWVIQTGSSAFFGNVPSYDAQEVHPNPDYSNASTGSDIGVVITKDAMAGQPLTINRAALDTSDAGQPVRLVGFGLSSSTNMQSAGTKRTTMTTLGAVLPFLLELDDTMHGDCEGDSGGPAFMKLDGTNEVIVGITSFGTHSDCSPPNFDTPVDQYTSFIDPYVMQFDPPPPPDLAPPPPGPDGFPPGAIGATCGVDGGAPCNAGNGCLPPPYNYCTASCDPTQMGACPTGTHCETIDDQPLCLRDQKGGGSGGCAIGGATDASAMKALGALLLVLAIALWLARRAAPVDRE